MKKVNWKKIVIDFLIITVLLVLAGVGDNQVYKLTEELGYIILIVVAVFLAILVPFMNLYLEESISPEVKKSKVLIPLGFNILAIIVGSLISISVNY